MRSGAEVVLHVGVQDAAQPALSADDAVIEAPAANGPDKSLDVRVVPGERGVVRISWTSIAVAVFAQALNV